MLISLFCFGTVQEREEAEKLFQAGGMAQKVVKAKLTDEEQAKIKVTAPPPVHDSSTARHSTTGTAILQTFSQQLTRVSLATLNSTGASLLSSGPKR
jgi:hypothetical protein